MIEINLIPDVKRELIKAQIIRAKIIIGSIAVGIISVAIIVSLVMYVYTFQALRSSDADAQIDKYSTQLSGVQDLSKMLTIQNQLSKISKLNGSKKIDSRIFDALDAMIPPSPNGIQITNLVIDSDAGTILIDGQAANSYAALEVFKKTIEGAIVKYKDADGNSQQVELATQISTSNVSYAQDTSGGMVLRFTISFTYAPELFDPASKEVAISITNTGNATDSYLGIPKSIFADPATELKEGQ